MKPGVTIDPGPTIGTSEGAVHNQAPSGSKYGPGGRLAFLPFTSSSLEDGYDIRTVQELLGQKDVKTTMIYTHVLNRGGMGVRSPADAL